MARNDFDLPPSLDWLVRRKLIIVRLTEVQCSPTVVQRLFCKRVAKCSLSGIRRRSFEAVSAVSTVPECIFTNHLCGSRSTFRRGILASPTLLPFFYPFRVPSIICLLIEGFYASFSIHRRASPRLRPNSQYLAGEGRRARTGEITKGVLFHCKKSNRSCSSKTKARIANSRFN